MCSRTSHGHVQDAAKDVLSQEIISTEVSRFMAKSGSMQEEDLSALEQTIRDRLSGRTPPCDPRAVTSSFAADCFASLRLVCPLRRAARLLHSIRHMHVATQLQSHRLGRPVLC